MKKIILIFAVAFAATDGLSATTPSVKSESKQIPDGFSSKRASMRNTLDNAPSGTTIEVTRVPVEVTRVPTGSTATNQPAKGGTKQPSAAQENFTKATNDAWLNQNTVKGSGIGNKNVNLRGDTTDTVTGAKGNINDTTAKDGTGALLEKLEPKAAKVESNSADKGKLGDISKLLGGGDKKDAAGEDKSGDDDSAGEKKDSMFKMVTDKEGTAMGIGAGALGAAGFALGKDLGEKNANITQYTAFMCELSSGVPLTVGADKSFQTAPLAPFKALPANIQSILADDPAADVKTGFEVLKIKREKLVKKIDELKNKLD